MTRKERVTEKKREFVKEILKEVYKATDLAHGVDNAFEFVTRKIKARPQEKSFYNYCLAEAMATLKEIADNV